MKLFLQRMCVGLTALSLLLTMMPREAQAASHAEAPLISMDRYADNTDTYAFRSTASGRSGFVTILANFIPFQDPSGGPHFYRFDDTVRYEIKIDNTGDGRPDILYYFQFQTQFVNGDTVLGMNAVNQDGVISSLTDPDYNTRQTYTVTRLTRIGTTNQFNTVELGSNLRTPPSNIGPRVTPNYEQNLGSQAVYNIQNNVTVFAGQRDEGFYIDLGGPFDALNLTSIGTSGGISTTQEMNVSTIGIEVPIESLTRSGAIPAGPTSADAVVGIWSTSSRIKFQVLGGNPNDNEAPSRGTAPRQGGYVQVSRLGNPLVNELVIPLRLKDAFNLLKPTEDAVAVPFVLDPELARLLQTVFGINIPPPPRNDLAQIFALGIPVNSATGPNYTTVIQGTDGPHEYLRLNVAIPPSTNFNRLGLLGGDVAGFPNGRRVGDDVVDIALRAVAGGTPFTPATNVAPNNTLGDGVSQNDMPYLTRFPYLGVPHQGNRPRTSNFPAQ